MKWQNALVSTAVLMSVTFAVGATPVSADTQVQNEKGLTVTTDPLNVDKYDNQTSGFASRSFMARSFMARATTGDKVVKDQTVSGTYTLQYGGYWIGSIKATLTYDIHYNESKPYIMITKVNVAKQGNFTYNKTGGGFIDAFFFTKTNDGITPAPGWRAHHIHQPESVGYWTGVFNNWIKNDSRYITGFYSNNHDHKSGQLNTRAFSPYRVDMNADGTFTALHATTGVSSWLSATDQTRLIKDYPAMNFTIKVPGTSTSRFVDEQNKAVPGSANKALSGGEGSAWTNPDGSKVQYKTGSDGTITLTGLLGQRFPRFAAPTFPNYTYTNLTYNFSDGFKFTPKPHDMTYHYYKNAVHNVRFVDMNGKAIASPKAFSQNGSDGAKQSYTAPAVASNLNFDKVTGEGVSGATNRTSTVTYDHKKKPNTTTTYYYAPDAKHTVKFVDQNNKPVAGMEDITTSGHDGVAWTYNLPKLPAGYNFDKVTGTGVSSATNSTTTAKYDHRKGNTTTVYHLAVNAKHTVKFVDQDNKPMPGMKDVVTNGADGTKWSYNPPKTPAGYNFDSVTGDGVSEATTTTTGGTYNHSKGDTTTVYHYAKDARHTIRFVDESGKQMPGMNPITTSGSDGKTWAYTAKTPAGYTLKSVTGEGVKGATNPATGGSYNHKKPNTTTTYTFYKNAVHTTKFVDQNNKPISGMNDIVTNGSDGQSWNYTLNNIPKGYNFDSVTGAGVSSAGNKTTTAKYDHAKAPSTTTVYHLAVDARHTINFIDEQGKPMPNMPNVTTSGSDGTKWSYTTKIPAGYSIKQVTGEGVTNKTSATTGSTYTHKKPNTKTTYQFYKNAVHTINFVDQNNKPVPGMKNVVTNGSDGKSWSYTLGKLPAGYGFVKVTGAGVSSATNQTTTAKYDHVKSPSTSTTYHLSNEATATVRYVDDNNGGKVIKTTKLKGLASGKATTATSLPGYKPVKDGKTYKAENTGGSVSWDSKNVSFTYDNNYGKDQTVTVHYYSDVTLSGSFSIDNNGLSASNATSATTSVEKLHNADANKSWYNRMRVHVKTPTGQTGKSVGFPALTAHDLGLASGTVHADEIKVFTRDSKNGLQEVKGVKTSINKGDVQAVLPQQTASVVNSHDYVLQVKESWVKGSNLKGSTEKWTPADKNATATGHIYTVKGKTGTRVATGFVSGSATYIPTDLVDNSAVTNKSISGQAINIQDVEEQTVTGSLVDDINKPAPSTTGKDRLTNVSRGLYGKPVVDGKNQQFGYVYDVSMPFMTSDFKVASTMADAYRNGSQTSGHVASPANRNLGVVSPEKATFNGKAFKHTDKLTSFGGKVQVRIDALLSIPALSNAQNVHKGLDVTKGVLTNKFTAYSNAFGNTDKRHVDDLRVTVPQAKAIINPVKKGTHTLIANPDTVKSIQQDSYLGLSELHTMDKYTGWTQRYNGTIALTGGKTLEVPYVRRMQMTPERVIVTSGQTKTVGQAVSAKNSASGKYLVNYTMKSVDPWKGYQISQDKDLQTGNLNFAFNNPTSSVQTSTAVAPLDANHTGAWGTNDAYSNVLVGQTDWTNYSVNASNQKLGLDKDTKLTATKTEPWLEFENVGKQEIKPTIVINDNTPITEKSFETKDKDGNALKGAGLISRKTPTISRVAMTARDKSAKPTDKDVTYHDYFTLSDNANKFSVAQGKGFTNKVTIHAQTWGGWDNLNDPTKGGTAQTKPTYTQSKTLTGLADTDKALLQQTKGIKPDNDSTLYQPTTVTAKHENNGEKDAVSGKTISNVPSDDFGKYSSQRTSASTSPVSRTNIDYMYEIANSQMKHGDSPTQIFNEAKQANLVQITNHQFNVPTSIDTSKPYNMHFKFAETGANSRFAFSNPRFDIGKSITVTKPTLPGDKDHPSAEGDYLVTTPDYDNPDAGANATKTLTDNVKDFINKNN